MTENIFKTTNSFSEDWSYWLIIQLINSIKMGNCDVQMWKNKYLVKENYMYMYFSVGK